MKRAQLIIAAFLSASSIAAAQIRFDRPVREITIKLGPSTYVRPSRSILLRCVYYPAFVIKEEDDPGVKGPIWTVVAPTPELRRTPCTRAKTPDQRRLSPGDAFLGVSGNLIFTQAVDGLNEGIEFRIVEWPTLRTINQDQALAAPRQYAPSFRFEKEADGTLSIVYRRVVVNSCSIPMGAAICWLSIRRHYHIPPSPPPKCIGYIEPGKKAEWSDEPIVTHSAIAYPVKLILSSHAEILPQSGLVRCNAEE